MKLNILVDDHALDDFHGEHGLSIYIEDDGYRVLFDTGRSGTVLSRNAERLGLRLREITGLVLSHGHYDHTGGLHFLLRQLRGVQLFCHPSLFDRKLREDGSEVGTEITASELRYGGLRMMMDRAPQRIAERCLTTGQIERTCPYEPEPHGFLIEKEGRRYTDAMLDEEALVLRADEGIVVVVGCAHPGIINIVRTAAKMTREPVVAVVGGFHLADADDARIRQTVEALKESGVRRVYPAHCTGDKAVAALGAAFGENCVPAAAGMTIEF